MLLRANDDHSDTAVTATQLSLERRFWGFHFVPYGSYFPAKKRLRGRLCKFTTDAANRTGEIPLLW